MRTGTRASRPMGRSTLPAAPSQPCARAIFASHAAGLQLPYQMGLAVSLRATTISPDVSLSSRCTMPARATCQLGIAVQQAIEQGAAPVAGAGCVTSPAGLLTTIQSGLASTTSKSTGSGAKARVSGAGCVQTVSSSSGPTTCRTLAGPPLTNTLPASIQPCRRLRECSGMRPASTLSRRSARARRNGSSCRRQRPPGRDEPGSEFGPESGPTPRSSPRNPRRNRDLR